MVAKMVAKACVLARAKMVAKAMVHMMTVERVGKALVKAAVMALRMM